MSFSRRRFLARGLGLGIGAVLPGCPSSTEEPTPAPLPPGALWGAAPTGASQGLIAPEHRPEGVL